MSPPDVQQIVQRSVQNMQENWKANPEFNFTERDVIQKGGHSTKHMYRVWMLDGSPYNLPIAAEGHQLSPSQEAAERNKLKQEAARRQHESKSQSQQRIAKYQRERRQNHALLREMIKAFNFSYAGEESVNGRDCYVINAEPRAGYHPPTMETKALTGMRGKLWIDKREYQWVKVHVQVFKPVTLGGFIAHVRPGTQFTLEQAPVGNGVWLPTRFVTRVRANVLYVFSKNHSEEDTFSNYQYVGGDALRQGQGNLQ